MHACCICTAGGDSNSAAGRDSPSVEKQKKRTPAWCDRILWLPDRQLYQLAYGRGEVAVSCSLAALPTHSWAVLVSLCMYCQ